MFTVSYRPTSRPSMIAKFWRVLLFFYYIVTKWNQAIKNNAYALGFGSRFKLSKRTALVVDYFPVLNRPAHSTTTNSISIGFDIETGGHVFQLHFSNSTGMNERAFITDTHDSWGKGEIRFGFNLSRIFTIKKNRN